VFFTAAAQWQQTCDQHTSRTLIPDRIDMPTVVAAAGLRLYFDGTSSMAIAYRIEGEAEVRPEEQPVARQYGEAFKPATVASTRAHYWTLELLFQFSGRSQFLTRAVFSRILTSSLAAT